MIKERNEGKRRKKENIESVKIATCFFFQFNIAIIESLEKKKIRNIEKYCRDVGGAYGQI